LKIELLYFGRPSEILRISRESVDLPDELPEGSKTLADLLAWLKLRGENWQQALAENRVRCAINQEFCKPNSPIKAGDEVAIFSPISGG